MRSYQFYVDGSLSGKPGVIVVIGDDEEQDKARQVAQKQIDKWNLQIQDSGACYRLNGIEHSELIKDEVSIVWGVSGE